MKKHDIISALEDSKLFGGLIRDQSTFASWKVFLRGLFALPMTPEELEVFRTYTGRQTAPTKPFGEAYCIAGRRSGKSFMSAIIATYLGLFHDWRPFLQKGEIGFIMCIGADRRQAAVILNYIRGILSEPLFKREIERELAEEIRLRNGITVAVKTSDYRLLRGYSVVASLLDELAFFNVEGSNPSSEILRALRPARSTIPGSLILGISSPYSRSGPLWDSYVSHYGKDESPVLVWRSPSRVLNPTLSQEVVDAALRDDFEAARAEFLAEFRSDLTSFLSHEIIERSIVPGRFELPFVDGNNYCAFVDPSGGRVDSFTMGIAHKDEDGRIILDRLEERRPPLAPADVAGEFAGIMKSYQIYSCTGDRYSGEWCARAFEENGITYESSKLDKSAIYLEWEPALAQDRVELIDDKRLTAQMRGLERRTRSIGRDSVDHGPGGSDDCVNSVAGACVLAAKEDSARLEFIVL